MEQDLILSLLSEDGERYELMVKGAASGNSKRRAHLEIMNLIEGHLYHSRSHIYLQNPQCKTSFIHLKSDLKTLIPIQLFLEIIEKSVLEKDPQPEIYQLLHKTLDLLNKKNAHSFTVEIALIKLAHHLGFLPDFKKCSHCHQAMEEDDAHWNLSRSTLECKDCSQSENPFPLKYRKALEFFRRAEERDWQQVQLNHEEETHLKALLPPLFTAHMDQPLKSLALLI